MNGSTENLTSHEVHPSTSFTVYEHLVLNLKTGLLCCNLFLGVPTHSYVLWLIARGRRFSSEFFNVNLTVCEIIYSLVFLVYLLQIVKNLGLLQRFVQALVFTSRPLFQCLMCVERYLAVVYPVTFLKYKPLRYRVICCAAAWIMIVGSCSGSITLKILSCLKTYTLFVSTQFLIFLFIQLFCLVAVLRALKQSGPGERNEENRIKRRASYLILIITVTILVMFVPFSITGILVGFQQKQTKFYEAWYCISLCCFILTGFVQPVLYLHRVGKLFCLCSSERQIFLSMNLCQLANKLHIRHH